MNSLTQSFAQKCAGFLLTSVLAATSVSAQEPPAAPEGTDTTAPEERPEFPDKPYCLADVVKEDVVLIPYAALAGNHSVHMGFVGMVEVPPPPEDPEAEIELVPTHCLYKLPKMTALDDADYKEKLIADMTAPKAATHDARRAAAFAQADETFNRLCEHWEAQANGEEGTLRSKAPALEDIANAAEGTPAAVLREEAVRRCPAVVPGLTQ